MRLHRQAVVSCVLGLCLCYGTTLQADWKDLWQTPQQRALKSYEEGEFDRLLNEAPDSTWTGLGQFHNQDYPAASQTFGSRAEELRAAGDIEAANTARYNQGVSDVMAGRFQEAIDRFDAVLEEDPSFVDARHNREIARELLELQQQAQNDPGQQQEQNQDGEQGDQGESGNQQDGQSQNGEQSAEQQPDNAEGDTNSDASGDEESDNTASSSAQDDPSSSGSSGDDTSDPAGQSEEARQQAAEAAREALAAEAAQQDGEQPSERETTEQGTRLSEQPLSEEEQATEQLLRRIPDDPAGLLRRKLEQSHRNDYPEVRDAAEPW